jgi:rod shape-determining protein MreC
MSNIQILKSSIFSNPQFFSNPQLLKSSNPQFLMGSLFQIFVRNGSFVVFIVLEAICFYLIVQYNDRQRGVFSHTSMIFNQVFDARRSKLDRYIDAADSLQSLNNQVFRLQNELENSRLIRVLSKDTFYLVHVDSIKGKVSVPQFRFVSAEVINNSISSTSNWITINRGTNQGVKPNMGVVSRDGLVGIVRYVSADFSIVMSLLHRQTKISASLKRQGYFGSLIWDGRSSSEMTLTDIPKHVQVKTGDTVVTSGYSSIFPKGVIVGTVVKDSIPSGSNFFSIQVQLSNDMAKTDYVRVIENLFSAQLDTLQKKVLDNE